MQSLPEFNMMVDLETTSLIPWEGRPTSLAFVIFNRDFQVMNTWETRIVVDYLSHALFKDNVETLEFRAEKGIDKAESGMYKYSLSATLDRLFREFEFYKNMFVWSKPMKFDIMFLERACQLHRMHTPWHYRNVMDMRSFCMGMGFSPEELREFETKNVAFEGKPHTPLADAMHQMRVLKYCCDELRA